MNGAALRVAGALVGVALGMQQVPSIAVANGAAFFRPAGKDAVVDLVYVGTIRDRAGRRLDYADVTVVANDLAMTFPFTNDSLGHYRSPDVGALIKEAGAVVEPDSHITITCFVQGYKEMTLSVPRRTKGIQEIDFVLECDPSQDTPCGFAQPPARSTRTPAVGLMALLLTATGAYTATRRRSRADSDRDRA